MKNKILITALFFTFISFAQRKTCDKPKKQLEDLNSITKCKIETGKKNKGKKGTLNVSVSASKAHFHKRKKSGALKKRTSISIQNLLSAKEVKKAHRFNQVDEVPAFKSCKSKKGDNRLKCFNVEMVNHITKYFNYPDEAIIKKIEGVVWIRFIIDKNGNVTNLKTHTRKPGKEILKEEAYQVVANLKKFKPATKDGKRVSVKYGFPITFSLSK